MSARGSVPFWAEWLFRVAMCAHPRSFREQYGDEMRTTFRDGWREERVSVARGIYLLRSIGTALITGFRQRRQDSDARSGSPDAWRLDLRHALRALLRRPALAVIIVATLAVGVGANAAVFAALHSIVLSPLPYPQSEQLVRVHQLSPDDAAGRAAALNSFGGYLTLPAAV